MFKRLHGARVWLLGIAGFVGIAAAVISYRDIANLFLPRFITPYLPLVMIVGFAAALWAIGSERQNVDGVLYREVVTLRHDNARVKETQAVIERDRRGRHLDELQTQIVANIVRKSLGELRDSCLAAGWSVKDASQTLYIRIIALGMDRENLTYRNEIASAFQQGGIEALLDEWPAGAIEHDPYLDVVTIAPEDSRNVVRPFVIDALRAVGLELREREWPLQKSGAQVRNVGARTAATMFVGQRR